MGRFLEYKKTLYGYYKYEPKYGMNYILRFISYLSKIYGQKNVGKLILNNKLNISIYNFIFFLGTCTKTCICCAKISSTLFS